MNSASFLNINLGRFSPSISISTSSTNLCLSIEKKQIIPNFFKLSFKSFRVSPFDFYSFEMTQREEEEVLDIIFFMVSDLIEHVLENDGHKKLTLFKPKSFKRNLLFEPLVQKIRIVFGQRRHLENILIEEDY